MKKVRFQAAKVGGQGENVKCKMRNEQGDLTSQPPLQGRGGVPSKCENSDNFLSLRKARAVRRSSPLERPGEVLHQ